MQGVVRLVPSMHYRKCCTLPPCCSVLFYRRTLLINQVERGKLEVVAVTHGAMNTPVPGAMYIYTVMHAHYMITPLLLVVHTVLQFLLHMGP